MPWWSFLQIVPDSACARLGRLVRYVAGRRRLVEDANLAAPADTARFGYFLPASLGSSATYRRGVSGRRARVTGDLRASPQITRNTP